LVKNKKLIGEESMKYLKTYPEKCTVCHICEETCSTAFFKEKTLSKSAIRVQKNADKTEIIVCNQCEACISCCPTKAISKNSLGVVVINKKECVGCLICIAECPCGAIFYLDNEPYPFKCIACGVCATKCPTKAIELIKE
jgi:Fe-S-cluster-containing hydrogenase component 2